MVGKRSHAKCFGNYQGFALCNSWRSNLGALCQQTGAPVAVDAMCLSFLKSVEPLSHMYHSVETIFSSWLQLNKNCFITANLRFGVPAAY